MEERSWSEHKLKEAEARSKDEDRTVRAHPSGQNGVAMTMVARTEPITSLAFSRSPMCEGEEEEKEENDVGGEANVERDLNSHRRCTDQGRLGFVPRRT